MANVFDALKRHQAEEAKNLKDAPAPAPVEAEQTPQAKAPVAAALSMPQPKGEPAAIAPASSAVLPADVASHYAPVIQAHSDRGGMIAEQFRAIRTSLLAQYPDSRFCQLITSAEPGEGKTVTTLNLAVMFAERQSYTTCVMDCDLRRGQIYKMLAGKETPGVAEYLRGQATFAEILQPTVYPNFSFIAAGGASRTEVAELLGRPQMEELIAQVKRKFDCVLIDTPPVTNLSDPGILGRITGEAMMVVRMGKTNRETTDRAIRLLQAANIKVSGMILTRQKYVIPNYLYKYS